MRPDTQTETLLAKRHAPVTDVRVSELNPDAVAPASERVLFIGNSHTFGNATLPGLLRRLRHATAAEMVTIGGATLQRHWQAGPARSVLNDTRFNWTLVILQDNGWQATHEPEAAFAYARKFHADIMARGMQTLWFMPHPYHRVALEKRGVYPSVTTELMMERNRAMATRLATDLALPVAPVGEAWWRVLQAAPEREESMSLYKPDGLHANPAGSFLTACVLGEMLGGCDPDAVAAETAVPDAAVLYAHAHATVTNVLHKHEVTP